MERDSPFGDGSEIQTNPLLMHSDLNDATVA